VNDDVSEIDDSVQLEMPEIVNEKLDEGSS
jgi:hypothetical protein